MINSKNFLILLVAIFVYFNVNMALSARNSRELSKLSLYKTKLKSEEDFLKNSQNIEVYIAKSQKNLKVNKQLLYGADIQNAILFNKMQSKIKQVVEKYNGKVINMIWGEPYTSRGVKYISLPFTLIIELKPSRVADFLRQFQTKEAIAIKQFHLIKRRDNILLNMQIVFYKAKKQKNEKSISNS